MMKVQSAKIQDTNQLLRAQNIQYVNEIHRLREINRELCVKIQLIEHHPNSTAVAYKEELDRNAELEEINTRQRRVIYSMKKDIERQLEEINTLRQRCTHLDGENEKQQTLIDRQKRQIQRAEDRVKILRHLNMKESKVSLELRQSISSDTEDLPSTISDLTEFTESIETPSPRNYSPSSNYAQETEPDTVMIEEKWTEKYSVIVQTMEAKKGKPGTENVEQNDMVSQDEMVELLALTKELLSQNEDLAEESNRWVQSINVQVQNAEINLKETKL